MLTTTEYMQRHIKPISPENICEDSLVPRSPGRVKNESNSGAMKVNHGNVDTEEVPAGNGSCQRVRLRGYV